MKILDRLKNSFFYNEKYKMNSEAVIIACYFNPQNNPYRLKAFRIWYDSIKHLNHHIVECVIGDSKPQLPTSDSISRIATPNLLWHKESILNHIITKLPAKYKYVFWLDTDVIFTNKNWLVDSVKVLQDKNICQPFEYCIHLDQDELKPSFSVEYERPVVSDPKRRHPKMWRSFCANFVTTHYSNDTNYDRHGHVGFAWGARREVLESVPLYDRALIGGSDHLIAHAAAGQIPHTCIRKSFTDDLEAINEWSNKFYRVVHGKIGYTKGDLYHIWHGDIEKRQYLKRIQEFTPKTKEITKKDKNGLYITNNGNDDQYVMDYFNHREVKSKVDVLNEGVNTIIATNKKIERREHLRSMYPDRDDSFIESLLVAYATDSTLMGTVIGGNLMGAMIGDALNNNDDQSVDMGGGSFGGGGSGGSWNTDADTQAQQTDNDVIISDNFS